MRDNVDVIDGLFRFEQDQYYALRRVPMVMRIKLDLSGYKLSIRDWHKLPRNDREALAAMPYEYDSQLAAFRTALQELIAAVYGDSHETDPCPRPAPWEVTTQVPDLTCRQISALGVPAPIATQWAALSNLQRYALVKLTREGAKNQKLPDALKEFGLMPPAS